MPPPQLGPSAKIKFHTTSVKQFSNPRNFNLSLNTSNRETVKVFNRENFQSYVILKALQHDIGTKDSTDHLLIVIRILLREHRSALSS